MARSEQLHSVKPSPNDRDKGKPASHLERSNRGHRGREKNIRSEQQGSEKEVLLPRCYVVEMKGKK